MKSVKCGGAADAAPPASSARASDWRRARPAPARLLLDLRDLVGDVAAEPQACAARRSCGIRRRAFEVEIAAHLVRHQINIGTSALSGEAVCRFERNRVSSTIWRAVSPASQGQCAPGGRVRPASFCGAGRKSSGVVLGRIARRASASPITRRRSHFRPANQDARRRLHLIPLIGLVGPVPAALAERGDNQCSAGVKLETSALSARAQSARGRVRLISWVISSRSTWRARGCG